MKVNATSFEDSPMCQLIRAHLCYACILFFMSVSQTAQAGEEYYLLMFGSQRVPANPNYSHTFTTFVRATWAGDSPCPVNPVLEIHTISWLPANLKIRTGALSPECGHNFDLHETLDVANATRQRVSLWGPYRIQPELYERALARKAELESGRVLYKANDMGYRSNRVSNCIHAVSSIVEGPKLRIASPGWGESASYFVLLELEPMVLSRNSVPEIGSALDLDRYPIIYRDWRNPLSSAAFGPFFRAFGSERGLKATYGPP
jgi:hypothetical protein